MRRGGGRASNHFLQQGARTETCWLRTCLHMLGLDSEPSEWEVRRREEGEEDRVLVFFLDLLPLLRGGGLLLTMATQEVNSP